MTHACQSVSTLRAMLLEAAGRLGCTESLTAQSLSSRIDELRRSIDENGEVTAEAEHEIVSLYVMAELEGPRSRSRSRAQ